MLKSDQQEKVPTTTPARSTAETNPPTDPKQCQQRTTDPPQKSDGSQQTMVNLRYHKTERKNQTINHYRATPQKWNLTELNLTTCPFGSTSETPDAASVTKGWQHLTHIWRPSRHEPNTGVLPWIRLHILSGIGGYAKSSLQGFSVDKSHVAEMANHNKMIIASTETGVDIRLASTSTTNPHCKGQIILRPDTMILRKLSTHAPQVVHEEIRCCLSNKRLTASHTKFLQNWTTHRDEWQLTNPDSQSDTQEAIQSERAKGTPLIQPS